MPASLNRLEPFTYGAIAIVGGALTAGVAYVTSPLVPFAVIAAAAVAILTAYWPLGTLYLAILAIPFKLVTIDFGGAGLSVAEALFVLSGVGWAVRRVISGSWPFVPSPLGRPYAFLLLAIIPGLLVAVHPFGVFKTLIMWTTFFLIYQMIVADGRRETVRTTLLLLAVSAALVGFLALVAPGTSQTEQLIGPGEVVEGRPGGSFQDPNILATFEALGLPAALALALGRRPALRIVGAGSFLFILIGLALSLSRGGFLAAAGALLVMLFWRPFRWAALVTLVIVLAFVTAGGNLFGDVQTANVSGRLQSVGYAASGGDPRFAIWRTTPTIIEDHPFFGIGENQFPDVALRYGLFAEVRGSYQHAHNIPLTIAAEMGLIGLTALTWVFVALIRVLVGAYRRTVGLDRGLVVAVGAAFAALTLQGMVDYTVSSNTVAAITFTLAACGVALWQAPPGSASVDLPAGAGPPKH